jgi:phenylpropionate dioxygenase-like ring-hydroxylating dioxygenase large terminal subunit
MSKGTFPHTDATKQFREDHPKTVLPSFAYFSPRIYELELKRIFYSKWLPVCHVSQLPKLGDIKVQDIGNKSVIITRGEKGQLRAFHNVCRHRGSRLINQSSSLRKITCPYHSWTYSLDGRLLGCPEIQGFGDFYLHDYSLYPVKIEELLGFVWINLEPNCETLSSYLGDFPARFLRYKMEDLVWKGTIGMYEIACNWKIFVEGSNECYHCQTVHPETLASVFRHHIPFPNNEIRGPYVMFYYEHPTKNGTIPWLRWSQATTSGAGPSEEDFRRVWIPWVFPNTQFNIAPDYVLTIQVWPDGPRHTKMISNMYVPKSLKNNRFLNQRIKLAFKSNDLINRQDKGISEMVQRGIESEVFSEGAFHFLEATVYHFQSMVRKALEDVLEERKSVLLGDFN